MTLDLLAMSMILPLRNTSPDCSQQMIMMTVINIVIIIVIIAVLLTLLHDSRFDSYVNDSAIV